MREPRQYQHDDLGAIREHLRAGARSVLWQAATGSGKTVGAAYMLARAAERGKRAWFVVHRRELLRQAAEAFRDAEIRYGLVFPNAPPYDRRLLTHICAIGTLRNRYKHMETPDLIVWDEAHHMSAASWAAIYDAFPTTRHIGLSATPERLDGQGLGKHFEQMVCGPSVAWLIEHGYLSPFRLFGPPAGAPDMDGVRIRAGDYAPEGVARVMSKPRVVGDAIDHYRKLAMGRPGLLFHFSIEESEKAAQRFRDVGIPAMHVDGKTDDKVRAQAILDLERGDLTMLCNVDLFSEGVSVNNVACVLDLAPTLSLAKYLQRHGRALRPSPGKESAVLLDAAGNALQHGFPDDERLWTLDGADRKRKPKDPDDVAIRQCKRCAAWNRVAVRNCTECGSEFPVFQRKVPVVDGELEEMQRREEDAKWDRVRRRYAARTRAELEAFARAEGMKDPHGYATKVLAARGRKRVA